MSNLKFINLHDLQVCTECDPERTYIRTFDVTERTALRRHNTGRLCHICGTKLRDTIVHFGEKGCLEWPLNWQGAIDAGKATDCIVCLGSSLKVYLEDSRIYGTWGVSGALECRSYTFQSRNPK